MPWVLVTRKASPVTVGLLRARTVVPVAVLGWLTMRGSPSAARATASDALASIPARSAAAPARSPPRLSRATPPGPPEPAPGGLPAAGGTAIPSLCATCAAHSVCAACSVAIGPLLARAPWGATAGRQRPSRGAHSLRLRRRLGRGGG